MPSPLIATKFFIPKTRQALVARPRLIKRLNQGLDRKMTLVSSPAGFGKTTLVSDWVGRIINDQIARVAWLSLDEEDKDPVRFLTYVAAALNRASDTEEPLGMGALSVLQSPTSAGVTDVLISLINDLAEGDNKYILVLDDYHLIEDKPIDEAIGFLLDNNPPQLHIVIATREDPALSLGRLRARNTLNELRAADLRFSSREAADFLNHVMGLDLTSQDIAELETRTEGWIAGLQLAAISMQGQKDPAKFITAFTGGHRLVLDFLIEEVIEQQPAEIQAFLLQTSVLERLTGTLCDAVTGQKNGQETLELLERINLFIVPLDNERRWYRYHHLFVSLLRQRLKTDHSGKIADLHRKASKWFEFNKNINNSIEHSIKGDDFYHAAKLIERSIDRYWGSGDHRNLERWLETLPEEVLLAHPYIYIYRSRYLCNMGQYDVAQKSLDLIEDVVNRDLSGGNENKDQDYIDGTPLEQKKLLGRIAATKGILASFMGDINGMAQYCSQALDLMPKSDLLWRNLTGIILGNAHGFRGDMAAAYHARYEALQACKAAGDPYLAMMAYLEVAITLRAQGRLRETIEICQTQMEVAKEYKLEHTRISGWLLAVWGETLVELNELEDGIQKATEGIRLAEESGDLPIIGWSLFCYLRALFSTEDFAQAEEIIQRMENWSLKIQFPNWILGQLAMWQARIDLAQNRTEEALAWVNAKSLNPSEGLKPLEAIHYFLLSETVVVARVLLQLNRLDDAIKLLRHISAAARNGSRFSTLIEILVLLSIGLNAYGEPDQAYGALGEALTLAEPEGFIRVFVDEGPSMAKMLYEALNRGITPEYVKRLLAAFPATQPEASVTTKNSTGEQSGLVEPLSEREIEVLNLIAKGLTNQVIAERLILSPHTIKTHARNIYSKLAVNNRTQAVDKARLLGILSSR